MKRIFETIDPWKIVQTSLDNADNCPAESVTSMGNGYMVRAAIMKSTTVQPP